MVAAGEIENIPRDHPSGTPLPFRDIVEPGPFDLFQILDFFIHVFIVQWRGGNVLSRHSGGIVVHLHEEARSGVTECRTELMAVATGFGSAFNPPGYPRQQPDMRQARMGEGAHTL